MQREIFIIGPIGSWLGVMTEDVLYQLRQAKAGDELIVRIDSDGGDAMTGVAINSLLRAHQGRKIVQVHGLAGSAASLIAMAGDEIIMTAASMMMIHNAWGVAIGDGDAMRANAEMNDRVCAAYAAEYARRTGRPVEEMAALMKRHNWSIGTWLTAAEAVAEKLADRVADPVPLLGAPAAPSGSYGWNQFAQAPVPARLASAPAALLQARGPRGREMTQMNKNEALEKLRAAAAGNPELLAAVQAMEPGKEPDGDEAAKMKSELAKQAAALEAEKSARVKAEAAAASLKYEDLIRAGKADRKIAGPAAEERVRAAYQSPGELERFLATVDPAPALQPAKAASGQQADTAAAAAGANRFDTAAQKMLARAGVKVDPQEYFKSKAAVQMPRIREGQ